MWFAILHWSVGGIFYDPGSIKPRLEIAAIVARDAARNVVGTKRKSAEVETGKKWVTRKVKKFDAVSSPVGSRPTHVN